MTLATLDGEEVVTLPVGSSTGDELKIRHKGVPYGHSRGDLILVIKVRMPKKLSTATRKILEGIKNELK